MDELQQDNSAPTTRGAWIEKQLADAIVSGELAPGQRLLASQLTEQYQVSLTPLREGLQRLVGRGLVEINPQRGARVADISAEDAAELYELRLLIEPVAVRQSVERLSESDKEVLREAFDEYQGLRTRKSPEPITIAHAHRRFHELLLLRCPSQRLRSLLSTLGDHGRRYAALTVEDPSAHRDPVGEHRQLLEAALTGDAEQCSNELAHHLQVGLEWAERRKVAAEQQSRSVTADAS